jgi:hypothetical protein
MPVRTRRGYPLLRHKRALHGQDKQREDGKTAPPEE